MTARTKRRLLIAGVVVCVTFNVAVVGGYFALNQLCIDMGGADLRGVKHEMQGKQRAEVIESMLKWARAAPLPESARVDSVTIGGSIFTRGYRVAFTAPADDIEDWLRRSEGVRDAVMTTPRSGVRHYQIKPGGGASFAQITVDDTSHTVVVDGYWS